MERIIEYIEKRLKYLALTLVSYEGSLEITNEREDRKKLIAMIEIGRVKIDELNKLKNECDIGCKDKGG